MIPLVESLWLCCFEWNVSMSHRYLEWSGYIVSFLCGILFTWSSIVVGLYIVWSRSFNNKAVSLSGSRVSRQDAIQDATSIQYKGWVHWSTTPFSSPSSSPRRFHSMDAFMDKPKRSFSEPHRSSTLPTLRSRKNRKSVVEKTLEGSFSVLSSVYKTWSYSSPVSSIPELRLVDEPAMTPVFVVVKEHQMYFYENELDTNPQVPLRCINLSKYQSSLWPKRQVPEYDLFLREDPIELRLLQEYQHEDELDYYYLYASSGSEKEDLFLATRRACLLKRSCSCHLSTNLQDEQLHLDSMAQLVQSIQGGSADTAWLNAILGRAFIGFQANPKMKDYILNRLGRRMKEQPLPSFLSDLHIQDIHIGSSVPRVSHPELIELGADGSLAVKMDIEYTGAAQVQVGCIATLSVPSVSGLDYFKFKPLSVPLVLAISIQSFSAQVLIKMKPYFESNRFWFGFYPDPTIKLNIVPIISNKGIQLEVVNQFIEMRIKHVLQECLVLPNLNDVPFWSSEGQGGLFCCMDPGDTCKGKKEEEKEEISMQYNGKEEEEKEISIDYHVKEEKEEISIDYHGKEEKKESIKYNLTEEEKEESHNITEEKEDKEISIDDEMNRVEEATWVSHQQTSEVWINQDFTEISSHQPESISLEMTSELNGCEQDSNPFLQDLDNVQEIEQDDTMELVESQEDQVMVTQASIQVPVTETIEETSSTVVQEDECCTETSIPAPVQETSASIVTHIDTPPLVSPTPVLPIPSTQIVTTKPSLIPSLYGFSSLLSYVPYQQTITHAIQDVVDLYYHPGPTLRVINKTPDDPLEVPALIPRDALSSLETTPSGSPERII